MVLFISCKWHLMFYHQGANRFISHAASSCREYWKRSCKRFSRPCQNSKRFGTILYPPQEDGSGIEPDLNLSAASLYFCSKNERDSMTSLWSLHQAPIWLPRGLVAKYFKEAALEIFSQRPSILTCRFNTYHGKSSATWGYFWICLDLELL